MLAGWLYSPEFRQGSDEKSPDGSQLCLCIHKTPDPHSSGGAGYYSESRMEGMGYPQRNPVKICLRRQNKGKSVERGGIGADLLSGTETDAGDH